MFEDGINGERKSFIQIEETCKLPEYLIDNDNGDGNCLLHATSLAMCVAVMAAMLIMMVMMII